MDEWTRERYPHGVPVDEQYARPRSKPAPTAGKVARRRIEVAGTDDLAEVAPGGDRVEPRRLRLLEAIRRWKP